MFPNSVSSLLNVTVQMAGIGLGLVAEELLLGSTLSAAMVRVLAQQ